jgi:hypothetical protein
LSPTVDLREPRLSKPDKQRSALPFLIVLCPPALQFNLFAGLFAITCQQVPRFCVCWRQCSDNIAWIKTTCSLQTYSFLPVNTLLTTVRFPGVLWSAGSWNRMGGNDTDFELTYKRYNGVLLRW